MKNTSSKINSPPWYKVGMVWVMIGLPFSVVVASMVTLVIAHQNAPIIITDTTNNR
jgi:hypothetical protein